jgi:hypothetical protein
MAQLVGPLLASGVQAPAPQQRSVPGVERVHPVLRDCEEPQFTALHIAVHVPFPAGDEGLGDEGAAPEYLRRRRRTVATRLGLHPLDVGDIAGKDGDRGARAGDRLEHGREAELRYPGGNFGVEDVRDLEVGGNVEVRRGQVVLLERLVTEAAHHLRVGPADAQVLGDEPSAGQGPLLLGVHRDAPGEVESGQSPQHVFDIGELLHQYRLVGFRRVHQAGVQMAWRVQDNGPQPEFTRYSDVGSAPSE